MAAPGGSLNSLRFGDTVLLYAADVNSYVFSELTSSEHNCVALRGVESQYDPNLPNIHFATFKIEAADLYWSQDKLKNLKERFKNRELSPSEEEILQQTQLLHTLTKKYLAVSATLSRTENTSLRVELQSLSSKGSNFKILPRYQERSVGDEVWYNHKVKFESLKTEQFLHYSAKLLGTVGFNVHADCHELNLSETVSAFTLIPHYQATRGQKLKTFNAGATVRLFHREYECYIAAEGSFAEDPSVVEEVHCRKRHSDHGILKAPSTSANTYWQFEKQSDPRSGEPLFWGERCRIKHLPTRKYLAVLNSEGEYKVTLKDRSYGSSTLSDLDTLFALLPVLQGGDAVLLESYIRIKHLLTRTWLHLEKNRKYIRRQFDPTAPGLKGLEWDSAELYMLSATEYIDRDDSFTLEQVEEVLVENFTTVAGIVPILTTHIRSQRTMLSAPPLDASASYQVSTALKELSEFLVTPSACDTKNRQKLLRNLRVLELVMEVLRLFKPDAKEQKNVYYACYLLIQTYLRGNSRKNENYLARFMKIFQAQLSMELGAEEVINEMLKDNIGIVSRMAETELDAMIQELVVAKDYHMLEFLGHLCVCGDRLIRSNQNAVLHKLVSTHGKDVFYMMEVGGSEHYPEGEPGVMYFRKPGIDGRWRKLTDIASRDVIKSDEFEFLKSQLRLFSKICKGNNQRAIAALDCGDGGYMTFPKALRCAKDYDLHPSLRSMYVQVINVMYVDVGENRDALESFNLSFVYNEVQELPFCGTEYEETVALTGVENVNFPEMKEWIREHVQAMPKLVALQTDENWLLAEVLSVLALLVKYGYYDDSSDVDDVMQPLLGVLNGFNDLPFSKSEAKTNNPQMQVEHFMKEGRYQETQENLAVFAIKERAMEVVELFFNFQVYFQLNHFIYEFCVLNGHAEVESWVGDGIGEVESGKSLHYFLQLNPGKQLEIPNNPHLVQLARVGLKSIFYQSGFFFENPNYNFTDNRSFPDILIDLSKYQSDKLVLGSLHLLNRFYSAEVTLFEKAIQTQLLVTDESRRVFAEIGERLPLLRRHMSVDAGESERMEIICTLNTFSAMCSLLGDDQQPHKQNQSILYNYGVLSDVLNYVLLNAKGTAEVWGKGKMGEMAVETVSLEMVDTREDVLVSCFCFLKAVAKNNIQAKRRLYDHMDDLLEIGVAISYIAEVLTEVFSGTLELCLKVREDQVEKLFQMVASLGATNGGTELIMTLQAIAKVEEIELPVIDQQIFIVKLFSITREKFCDYLLAKGKEQERWELLIQDQEIPDLQLLLAITDLLATCCEGENVFSQSVCQSVYSVEELLNVLSSPFLLSERKRPFARFLVWVYMNTGGDKNRSGASELAKSKVMWKYLEHIAVMLSNVVKVLRVMPQSEAQLLRRGLTQRCTSSVGQRRIGTPCTTSEAVPFVTGDDGKLLPGLLLYFCDGMLPLLKSFYADFFNPTGGDSDRESWIQISSDILTSLLHLCDSLTQYFTKDSQVKLYRTTVLTIMNSVHGDIPLQVEDQVLATFDHHTHNCTVTETEVQKAHKKYYSDEIKLNETFQRFASNVYLAYQGPNTARAQIGSRFDTKYSDLDDELKKRGDEYLPLGPSFQDHVACFVTKSPVITRDYVMVKPEAERLIKQLEISFCRLNKIGEEERQRQAELDIKSLQILRAIIHNEIKKHINPSLKKKNPAKFRRCCQSRVQPVQRAIQDLDNAASRVIPLLSHPNNEIVREVLAFLKTILFSGNQGVQRGLEYLLSTREEGLCTTVAGLLRNAASMQKKRQMLSYHLESRMDTEIMQMTPSNFTKIHTPSLQPDATVSEDIIVKVEEAEFIPLETIAPSPTLEESSQLATQSMRPLDPNLPAPLFKDFSKMTLQVLGLMCDGQYRFMQNYLREQRDNIHTVNLVGEVALFIEHFYHDINEETVELVHLILQTLIEMCVGNYSNQEVIFNHQILEALNSIFQIDITGIHGDLDYMEKSVDLKASAVELLEVMLEETNEKTSELVKEIAWLIDIPALHGTLAGFYELKNNPNVKQSGFDYKAERGLFRTYHVLVHLRDYEIPYSIEEHIEPISEIQEAWQFCQERSRSVEVFYKNMDGDKILTRVHFQFDLKTELTEDMIERVKLNVNRDSPEDKLRDFMEWMKALKEETDYQSWLHKNRLSHLVTSFSQTRYYILLFLSLLMNVFLLITYKVPSNLQETNYVNVTFEESIGAFVPAFPDWFRIVLFLFGAIHLFFSLWMLIEYFLINWKNFRLPHFFYYPLAWIGGYIPQQQYNHVNIFGLQTVYVMLFVVASILSLAFWGYFYCFCLLYIIVNNDILQRVLRSVTRSGSDLLWVAILFVVVLYIYSVVSFAFLHESFLMPNDDASLFCNTLFECLITMIRYGLMDNPGLVVPLVPNERQVAGLRLLYDISFFIIVTTIGLNIVFGIIVDGFSELRHEKYEIQQAYGAFCFICSIPSSEFERKAQGFDHHVKYDHNMWNYIYFSMYLDQIDTSDHNAIEGYVYEMMRQQSLEFFPLLAALELVEEETEDETAHRLEKLESMVKHMIDDFKAQENEMTRRDKLQEEAKWEEQILRSETFSFDPLSFDPSPS